MPRQSTLPPESPTAPHTIHPNAVYFRDDAQRLLRLRQHDPTQDPESPAPREPAGGPVLHPGTMAAGLDCRRRDQQHKQPEKLIQRLPQEHSAAPRNSRNWHA